MSQDTNEPLQTPDKSPVALNEERISAFWKKNRIFEQSVERNQGGKEYIFYDGPPFATGLPHYGHILPGTIKDVIPRYQTMRGRYVRRRWGWDCHGLPVENLIEKELGLSHKKDIENYGIERFNLAARNAVFRYVDEWKKIIPRTGRWIDMDTPYVTMDATYTESVWWSFAKLNTKKLVYEGYKVMPLCPRCETTLSNFEVNQGYKDIADISAYVRFALKNEPTTAFIAWTTTPWTLPGNTALAVNPTVTYVRLTNGTETVIVAKPRVEALTSKMPGEWTVVSEVAGVDLVGTAYVPPFSYYTNAKLEHRANAWKVYGADFVTTEDGTGIVHIAPAFGGDDYELAQQYELPVIKHVSLSGLFEPAVTDFAGQPVKPKDDHQKADVEVIKYLAHAGLLFAKEKITHSYPHCWRCDTPLLNYATSSWFVKVTAIKDKLVAVNKNIEWNPANIRDGRFGKWLEGAKDWAVSRSRFWGAPLPVWKCTDCKQTKFVASIAELIEGQTKKSTLYLIRHGEAEHNITNTISSKIADKHRLTSKGTDQARAAAQALKDAGIEHIYASPFERTRETAEVARVILGLPKTALTLAPDLTEINTGVFDGKSVDEYHAFFASAHERFTKRPEGGETYEDVRRRATKFMTKILAQHGHKKVLIVTHDSVLWMFASAARGLSEEQALELRSDTQFFFKNAEVRKQIITPLPLNEHYDLDLHRPYIDVITLGCACGGVMKRVPEVFDTWYDSGAVPFASQHYPFAKGGTFKPTSIPFISPTRGFPADFIAEGLDQTRGWFYTQLVLSVALFNRPSFKRVLVNGLLLAEDGRKMSKRLNNYPDVSYVFNKYGADALRYYLMASPAVRAEDVNFSEKGVDEVYKKNILRLDNVCSLYEMYPDASTGEYVASPHVLDQWICARLAEVSMTMTKELDLYQIDRAAWPIEKFIDDVSTWYVRRSRERLKGDDLEDKTRAQQTLKHVLLQFSKMIAPYMPFIAEDIYQRVTGYRSEHSDKSVHLTTWPALTCSPEDMRRIADMNAVRVSVSLALEARAKAGVKVRQPLAQLTLKHAPDDRALLELIKEEINVKNIAVDQHQTLDVLLDTVITPALKQEGEYRDLLRAVQDLRKQHNLIPTDRVHLVVTVRQGDTVIAPMVSTFTPELTRIAGLTSIKVEHTPEELEAPYRLILTR